MVESPRPAPVEIPLPEPGAADAVEPPKRKRGRPPKSASSAASGDVSKLAQDVSAVISGAMTLVARAVGPEWEATPEEVHDTVGAPLARILARHVSAEALSKYSDAFALGMGALLLFGPRVAATFAKRKEKGHAERAESAPAGNPGAGKTANTGRVVPISDAIPPVATS